MSPASPFPIDSSSPTVGVQHPASPPQNQADQRRVLHRPQSRFPLAAPASYGADGSCAIPRRPGRPPSDWHRTRFSSSPLLYSQHLTIELFHVHDGRIEAKSLLRTHLPTESHLLTSDFVSQE